MHEGKELMVLWLLPTLWPPLGEAIPGSLCHLPTPSSHSIKGTQQAVHVFWTGKQLHLV